MDWQEIRGDKSQQDTPTYPNLPRQVKDKFDLLSPQLSQPKRPTAKAVLSLTNWLKTRKTSDEYTLFPRHDRVINREWQLLNGGLKTSQLQHSNEPKTHASMTCKIKTGDDKKQRPMKSTECTRMHHRIFAFLVWESLHPHG